MSPDTKLMIMFGAIHLIGMVFIGMLLVMFVRSDTITPWSPDDDGDDGGGSDRVGPQRPPDPGGGDLPLPDARPARRRLREPARLGDLTPERPRRPAREPARTPGRTPASR